MIFHDLHCILVHQSILNPGFFFFAHFRIPMGMDDHHESYGFPHDFHIISISWNHPWPLSALQQHGRCSQCLRRPRCTSWALARAPGRGLGLARELFREKKPPFQATNRWLIIIIFFIVVHSGESMSILSYNNGI